MKIPAERMFAAAWKAATGETSCATCGCPEATRLFKAWYRLEDSEEQLERFIGLEGGAMAKWMRDRAASHEITISDVRIYVAFDAMRKAYHAERE